MINNPNLPTLTTKPSRFLRKGSQNIMEAWRLFATLSLICIFTLFIRLYNALVREPKRLRASLSRQGVRGPPPTLLLGNILEIKKARAANKQAGPAEATDPSHEESTKLSHKGVPALFAFLEQWRHQFGDVFMFALGNSQILCVVQPDLVKEITTCTTLDLGKPSHQQQDLGPLLGQGILTSNGSVWAHQRKILAPELYMDKVKGMMSLIVDSTNSVIRSWSSAVDAAEGGVADINVDQYLRSFSGDVISRACFGSNYAEGEEIFLKLRALQEDMSKKGLSTGVPGMRHIPTKSNLKAWALEKEIRNLILQVAQERKQGRYEKDLLQMVLEGAQSGHFSQQETDRFIVDNCKNIYLAGYETTAVAATWCLVLLASDHEWQDRVRAEVVESCKGGVPDFDMLRKLKQMSMVIHEALRLYPPVPIVSRQALEELKFGSITVPKNVNVWTVVTSMHTDPEVWGPDAYEFNPSRFENGISGACKHPYFYMPFGVGPRMCLGQNLAMVELKILISLLVSNFSFAISPSYIHAPALRLVIEPEHEVQLLIKKL